MLFISSTIPFFPPLSLPSFISRRIIKLCGLKISLGLNWHFKCKWCTGEHLFFYAIIFFLKLRNHKCPSLSLLRIELSILIKIFLQTLTKRKNVAILNCRRAPTHCTLMADGVQWLSQSDYNFFFPDSKIPSPHVPYSNRNRLSIRIRWYLHSLKYPGLLMCSERMRHKARDRGGKYALLLLLCRHYWFIVQ